MKCNSHRSPCPVSFALDIFGDRWTLLIVRDMAVFKRQTFKEFLEAGEGIATNILSSRLTLLEKEGIVKKETDDTNKSRNIYTLTQKGYDLLPTMVEMIIWSGKYDEKSPFTKKEAREFEKNKTQWLKSLAPK